MKTFYIFSQIFPKPTLEKLFGTQNTDDAHITGMLTNKI